MSAPPVSKPSPVQVPVDYIRRAFLDNAADRFQEARQYHGFNRWCTEIINKIIDLDLLDGKKDRLIDGSVAEQIGPALVALWEESRASLLQKEGTEYPGTTAEVRELIQSRPFRDRLLALFDPGRKGLEARYAYTPYADNPYTLGGPDRVVTDDPHTYINVKALKSDLARLAPGDRIELLLSLRQMMGSKTIHRADGGQLWLRYLLWEELFPHLQGIYQEEAKGSEIVGRLLGQLKIKKAAWEKQGGTDSTARLEFLATWFYLDDYLDHQGRRKFSYPILKKIEVTLDKLYDPALFDTDGDGKVDGADSFPSYSYYREDANGNQLPDELEKLGRDPAHLFGLKEGQLLELRHGNHLNLLRLQDQVYLIVNVSLTPAKLRYELMRPDTEVADLRERWQREIETAYRKMLPPEVAPLEIRVNFFTPEGEGVEVYDGYLDVHMSRWMRDTDTKILCHELGHHLGWADRYSRSNPQYEMGRYITDPGVFQIWKGDHLMNENSYVLDPVDLMAVVDSVLRNDKALEEPNLGVAEIYLEHGKFAEAEAIYRKNFEKYRGDDEVFFPEERGENYQREVVAMEALKGYLHARLHRYYATRDKSLLPEVDAKLDWMEQRCRPEREYSTEAAWYYREAQRLRQYRDTGQDPYAQRGETELHAPLPVQDRGVGKNGEAAEKFAPLNIGLLPVAAQRIISTGTGRMGYFNKAGDQVNPQDYSGAAQEELHRGEVRKGSMETGMGIQAQWAHRFWHGHFELLGQGGLLRFTNFANSQSRTEINATLGLNLHLISREDPEAIHPYAGVRLGGHYDLDHQTMSLSFNGIIPTVLGLRAPLGEFFQLDAHAGVLPEVRPEQGAYQDQWAVRFLGGIGILYQP